MVCSCHLFIYFYFSSGSAEYDFSLAADTHMVVPQASNIGCGRLSPAYWKEHNAYLNVLVMDA